MTRRYEFRVEGWLGAEARYVLADMQIVDVPPQTVLVVDVIDQSHLLGIIAHLHALGFTVVSAQPDPLPSARLPNDREM